MGIILKKPHCTALVRSGHTLTIWSYTYYLVQAALASESVAEERRDTVRESGTLRVNLIQFDFLHRVFTLSLGQLSGPGAVRNVFSSLDLTQCLHFIS